MRIDGLDGLDRQIVHSLYVAPRAPYRQIGAALGVSDQTVARRYQALRARAGLRVTGCLDGRRLGWAGWMLRLQCTPDAAAAVALALARRRDTSWVRLASGGTEVHCAISAPSSAEWDALLLDKLTGTRRIVAISAYSVLHVFAGMTTGWSPAMEALDGGQLERLGAAGDGAPADGAALGPEGGADGVVQPLGSDDWALLDALDRDGRISSAELAAVTGWHESTVRRRIDAMQRSGLLYFDVDIDERAFGVTTAAMLWLSVAPARLAAVGGAMATHREVAFVGATSGPTNLAASVVCRDSPALYRYLSERVGGLEGTLRVETAPVIRTLKRSGALVG